MLHLGTIVLRTRSPWVEKGISEMSNLISRLPDAEGLGAWLVALLSDFRGDFDP
jgi:hypothetical protein